VYKAADTTRCADEKHKHAVTTKIAASAAFQPCCKGGKLCYNFACSHKKRDVLPRKTDLLREISRVCY
jgi:hypothetical protein